jgi:adenylate cyclase
MPVRKIMRRKAGWTALLVATFILLGSALLRMIDPAPLAHFRDRTFDVFQRIQPRPYADFPVRIVDIDEASLGEIGQWPWPRTTLARVVQRLNELGASVIAFDVWFPEPDRTSPRQLARELRYSDEAEARRVMEMMGQMPDHDGIFAAAIAQAPVVLGFATAKVERRPPVKAGFAFAGTQPQQAVPPFQGATGSLDILEAAASGIGGASISSQDRSGIVRQAPMLFTDGSNVYPSLSAEALRIAQQATSFVVRGTGASEEIAAGKSALVDMRVGEFAVPLTADGAIWVYYDRDRPERYVSARDILDPAKDATTRPRIEGHVIFVGTSAAGLLDIWPSPLGELVPGVSVHAQVVEQIVSQTFLYRPDWTKGLETVLTVSITMLLTWLLLVIGAQYVALIGAIILGATIAASWIAFTQFGLLLDPLYPSLTGLTTYLAVVGVLYVATDKEKRFVRGAFGQYLAPELLSQLEESPDMMRLGGEIRPLTLLFMDVRGFTSISEALTAQELVEFMNRLLTPLTDAIQSELGTIDKYIGDAIMAFWNAPLAIPDHPLRACRAALKMRAVLRELNESDSFGFAARGLDHVRIGIGLNTGEASVGNMGSERRFNYSAMGDVVNTTARIESNTKMLGFDIVVSDSTIQAAPGFAVLEAGELLMKGKSRPVKLYALVGDEQVAATAEFQDLARLHERLMRSIAEHNHAEAARALALCRGAAGEALTKFYDRLDKHLADLVSGVVQQQAAE